MTMFYSAGRRGFFHESLHVDRMPVDAVEISDGEHQALLAGQAAGQAIVPGPDGRPTLQDRPGPSLRTLRRAGYGPIGDMLDMLYRDLKAAGVDSEFVRHVEAVKASHPKSSA